MSDLTNLAAAVTAVLAQLNTRDAQFAAWLAGVPLGGPNGDGRYPLTDFSGTTRLVSCPTKIEADAAAVTDALSGAAAAAEAARVAAVSAASSAEAAQTAAASSAALAATSASQADTFRQQAASAAGDVLTLQNAISTLQTQMTEVRDVLNLP